MSKEIDAQRCRQNALNIRRPIPKNDQRKDHQKMAKKIQFANLVKHGKKIAKAFWMCKGQEFIHLLSDKKHIEEWSPKAYIQMRKTRPSLINKAHRRDEVQKVYISYMQSSSHLLSIKAHRRRKSESLYSKKMQRLNIDNIKVEAKLRRSLNSNKASSP